MHFGKLKCYQKDFDQKYPKNMGFLIFKVYPKLKLIIFEIRNSLVFYAKRKVFNKILAKILIPYK